MKNYIRTVTWNNGNIMFETPIVNGRWNGLRVYYLEDSRVYSKTPYKNNLRCGAKIEIQY